jgi:hypothetical protein
MSSFVPLPLLAGGTIYVNPDLVASLLDAGTTPVGTFVDIQGDAPSRVTVAGTPAAIAALLGAGSTGGVVGPLSTVYVEPPSPAGRGNDATGERGNAARPFATLQAALTAASDGDTIALSSGTYAPPTGPVKAALQTLNIIGTGASTCVIESTSAPLPCLDVGGTARNLFMVRGLRMQNTAGGFAFAADGSGAAVGTFFNSALALAECTIAQGDLVVKYAGTLVAELVVYVGSGTCKLESIGTKILDNIIAPACAWQITDDNDDPLAPTAGGTVQLGIAQVFACELLGAITLDMQARMAADRATTLGVVSIAGSAAVAGPGWVPSPQAFLGSVAGVIANPMPDATQTIDVSGARITGPSNIVAPPGAVNTITLNASGAVFEAGATLALQEQVLANLRTASFVGGILGNVSTGGTNARVIPPTFSMPALPAAIPTAFAFGFKVAGVSYDVAIDTDTPGAAPAATTLRNNLGCEVTPTAAVGTIAIVVNYFGT